LSAKIPWKLTPLYCYISWSLLVFLPRNYQRDDREVLRWKSFSTQEISTADFQTTWPILRNSFTTKHILGLHCLPRTHSPYTTLRRNHSTSNRCHFLFTFPLAKETKIILAHWPHLLPSLHRLTIWQRSILFLWDITKNVWKRLLEIYLKNGRFFS